MESQSHRTYGDRLHPTGAVVHQDEADTLAVNDSVVVRSGLAEPTVMGTPVLAENMYATRSNMAEPPMRSSAQCDDQEKYYAPPTPSTDTYETHLTDLPDHGGHYTLNREPFKGGFRNPTGFEDPVGTRKSTAIEGEKEVGGITGLLHSLDKMKVFDEHDTEPKSDQTEPEVYTGCQDQFAPEPVINNLPLDTIAANPSNPNSSYTQIISSATSALADKAGAVKDSIVSKLSYSGENKTEGGIKSPKTSTKSSFPTAFSHKVADTLSSTLGPVYDKLASKTQGSGHDEGVGSPGKGSAVTVKEFLVDTFKPGEDDKVLSEAITHAFHRGKGNQLETTTTTYVVKEEGERRLQESGN